jgi:hypothetical protein
MRNGWAQRADVLAGFSLQSQRRYHEDIFGAVYSYQVRKDRTAGQTSDGEVEAAGMKYNNGDTVELWSTALRR